MSMLHRNVQTNEHETHARKLLREELEEDDDHDEKRSKSQLRRRRDFSTGRCWRKKFAYIFLLLIVFQIILSRRKWYLETYYLPPVNFFNPDAPNERLGSQEIIPEVCFVTSSYSKNAAEMDKLVEINNLSPYLRFYLFTNLNDEQWKTPGWTKIVTNLGYRRMITHSRYGKFMGWKHMELRECKAVFYFDSCLTPAENQTLWRELADQIYNDHESGLMQSIHPNNRSGVISEFLAIQHSHKDIEGNIVKSLNWMIGQDDFDPTATVYLNENFGYNPNSYVYQKTSKAFWERYSLEEDSWRDQPLWSFMLHRFNVIPLPYPVQKDQVWKRNTERTLGHNRHEYLSEKDVLV